MRGADLKERREAHGLTRQQVARAAGTSEADVAAFEDGRLTIGDEVPRPLLAAVEAGADSVIHQRNLLTVPAAAAALTQGLQEGWSTADLLRLVREMRSNAAYASSQRDRAAFFAEPPTTGDPRWDALLAGSTEQLALREEFAVPEWTRGHALPEFWFVGASRSLQAYAFARSPFPLQVRGVMVDPADLESV